MSLLKTLAKVAVGVVIAKGVSGMMQKGTARTADAGSGDPFGGANSPRSGGTGLEDIMGSILGGKPGAATSQAGGQIGGQSGGQSGGFGDALGQGGLGGLLEQLAGGKSDGGATQAGSGSGMGGGLNDILGQLTGRGGAGGSMSGGSMSGGGMSGGGGLGDLLGGLLGGAAAGGGLGGGLGGALGGALGGGQTAQAADSTKDKGNADKGNASNSKAEKGFGDLFNEALVTQQEPVTRPTEAQDAAAALMLRAMIMAAKSDGKIDATEQQRLLGNLGDATPQDMAFVKAELAAPVDLAGLVRQTPAPLAPQVYAMSVMAIDLDNQAEAKYLHGLAQGLGISQQDVNRIHAKLGKPALYS